MYRRTLFAAALAVLTLSAAAITSHHSPGTLSLAPGLVTVAEAGGKPTPTPVYNITSTIHDYDTEPTTGVITQHHQLRSDEIVYDAAGQKVVNEGSGVYKLSSADNVNNRLGGVEQSEADLTTEQSATRGIYLTLVRLSGTGPTGDTPLLRARVINRCFEPAGGTVTSSWFSIAQGASNPNCAMRVNFKLTDGGGNVRQYSLVMSPNYANTGRAIVTCTAAANGKCSAWTVQPNPTLDPVVNPNPGVANLLSADPKNGKTTVVGTYSLNSFRMNVTYP